LSKSTQQVVIKLGASSGAGAGSGLFAGASVRVYVTYYDLASKATGIATAIVTLR